MAQTQMIICNLLIINILRGGGKTRYPNLCFPRFLLKNDPILRLTFCQAAFGVQFPKTRPLSLSKWRMGEGENTTPLRQAQGAAIMIVKSTKLFKSLKVK